MERKAFSMQTISEENPSMPILPSFNDGSSIQLLIKAKTRIRELQKENQQLYGQMEKYMSQSLQKTKLEENIRVLGQCLQAKALQIHDLQQIHERTVAELTKVERELKQIKLNSSLNSIKRQLDCSIANIKSREEGKLNSQKSGYLKNDIVNYQSLFSIQNNRQSKLKTDVVPSKDKYVISKSLKSNQHSGIKIGPYTDMNALIKKVYSRQDESINLKKDKMKDYRNYCVGIQKKYSHQTISPKQAQQSLLNVVKGAKIKKSPLVLLNGNRNLNYSSFVSSATAHKNGQISENGMTTGFQTKQNNDSLKFQEFC